ncbi:MAG: hypothetical protein HZA95_02280 [Candidatus Vogelbacteria bacterium]|nr:hypothetical protein [Candidatus Vogelbacteria bacterium]
MNKYKKYIAGVAGLGAVLTPMMAFAVGQNVINIIDVIALILNRVVGIVIIIALIWFIWGLAEYIEAKSGKAENRPEGRERMVMGAIAFFAIVSIWGLVRFLQTATGVSGSNLRNDEIPYIGNPVTNVGQ